MEPDETFARQLRRHAERRRAGQPTVTVLLGDATTPVARLQCHLATGATGLIVMDADKLDALVAAWLRSLVGRDDLEARAFAVAAGGRPEKASVLRAQWAARTARERERWLGQLIEQTYESNAKSALEWLRAHAQGTPRDDGPDDSIAALGRLAGWLPSSVWPSVCVRAYSAQQLERLVAVATDVPSLPLFAVVPADAWARERAQLSSRARSLLSEGLVLLREDGSKEDAPVAAITVRARERSEAAGRGTEDVASLLERAAEAHARARAIEESAREADEQSSERARSLAELLLFEMLERDEVTRGCFELNGTLSFDFGRQPAEIDLLCQSLDLAVEVDGYFRFIEPSRYRRDRRKDLLLQTHGFVVARYMAADVVERGSEVVSSIRTLVELRKQTRNRSGGRN